jgi:hypothetical protein
MEEFRSFGMSLFPRQREVDMNLQQRYCMNEES